jgi:hypothetical protein
MRSHASGKDGGRRGVAAAGSPGPIAFRKLRGSRLFEKMSAAEDCRIPLRKELGG